MDSPEFQPALNEACEKQYRGWLFGGEYVKAASKDSVGDTLEEIERERKKLMAKHEGYMREAELVKLQSGWMRNPHMREITGNLKRKQKFSGLVCPVCGGGDKGNTVNGKPVCYMNAKHRGLGPIPLMTAEKAKDWKPPEKKKPKRSYTFNAPDGVVRKRG